jgi:hypothetical protein
VLNNRRYWIFTGLAFLAAIGVIPTVLLYPFSPIVLIPLVLAFLFGYLARGKEFFRC